MSDTNIYEVTLNLNDKKTFGFGYDVDKNNNPPGIFIINVGSDQNGPVSYTAGSKNIPINDGDKLIAVRIDRSIANNKWQIVNTGNNNGDFNILQIAIGNADMINSPMSFRIQRNPSSSSSSSSTIEPSVPTDKNIYTVTVEREKGSGLFGVIPELVGGKIIVKSLKNPIIEGDNKINIGDQILAINDKDLNKPGVTMNDYYRELGLTKQKITLTLKKPEEPSPSASSIPSFSSMSTSIPSSSSSSSSIATEPSSTSIPSASSKPILTETIVPLPKSASSTITPSDIPSDSSSASIGGNYLTNDPTLKKNQNVGTIVLNNGYSYYGPMDPVIDITSNPPYELLKVSEQYGKILGPNGKTENTMWFNILYDPANAIMTPSNDWKWTNNYLIKQQYVKDDASLTENDENSIVIFVNDYIYEGPLRDISIDRTVPHYEITLLHISSKYGQIKNTNGDVIIKPTDVPLIAGILSKTATSATPSSSITQQISWADIVYDNSNITIATDSIKKLTGIWEWIDYFANYFSIPGLVMPDPNTQFSELLEQELIKKVNMDNIIFKTDNLQMMKSLLGHEIVVFGQAIIMTLKYIYENNITAYKISDNSNKQKCGINAGSPSSESELELESELEPQSILSVSSFISDTGTLDEQYNAAYKLYEAGQLSDCLESLDKILPGKGNNTLSSKVTLLRELCKLEQNPNLTQEEGNRIIPIIEKILHLEINDSDILNLVCNVYYYLYIGTLNKSLESDINNGDYEDDDIIRGLKTLQINTFANIFEVMNLSDLQDKYRTIYIKQLTAQDKEKYETEINNTIAAADKAEKASKWTLANILYERAHRYAVVYFGLDDTQFTSKIEEQKQEYIKRQSVATNDLTKMIENLYKQLSMENPQSAFTTFYSEYATQKQNKGFNPNIVKEESKTAIKAILASVSKDETGVDFFKNMNKDIKIENMNIYDLLLILIKNIILCLNVYLIVISKIYRDDQNPGAPSIIVSYFQTLNLYYGFKQCYTKLLRAIDSNRTEKGVNIEDNPEAIVLNNSEFTNSLLLGLSTTLGLSGITIGAAFGGKKRSSTRRKTNKLKRRKMLTRRKYNKNKNINKKISSSRKLRRKYGKYTR